MKIAVFPPKAAELQHRLCNPCRRSIRAPVAPVASGSGQCPCTRAGPTAASYRSKLIQGPGCTPRQVKPQLAQTELLPSTMVAATDAPPASLTATPRSAAAPHARLQLHASLRLPRRPRTRRGSSEGGRTRSDHGAATLSDGAARRSGGGATLSDGGATETHSDGGVPQLELPEAPALLLPKELPLHVPPNVLPEQLPAPGTVRPGAVWPGSADTVATAAAPCRRYGRCVSFGLESGPTRHATRHATRSPAAAAPEGTSLDPGSTQPRCVGCTSVHLCCSYLQ